MIAPIAFQVEKSLRSRCTTPQTGLISVRAKGIKRPKISALRGPYLSNHFSVVLTIFWLKKRLSGRSKKRRPYFLPNQYPTSPPIIAATGASAKSQGAESLASHNTAEPAPDAAIPARKTTSPPGNTKPINKPVSMKMIAKTPIRPRVETTAEASNRLVMNSIPVRIRYVP